MQWDIDGFSSIECDGWQVLVEEGLKHDDLVALFQKGDEDRVLTCQPGSANVGFTRTGGKPTFVSSTRNQYFRFDIKISAELMIVVVFESLPQTWTAFGMGVVVGRDGVQCLLCRLSNPLRGSEVHVPLAQIDAVRGEIGSTGTQ